MAINNCRFLSKNAYIQFFFKRQICLSYRYFLSNVKSLTKKQNVKPQDVVVRGENRRNMPIFSYCLCEKKSISY